MNGTMHPVAPEEVMAFLDGELSPEKSALFIAHLDGCTDCKELAARFKTTSQALSKWGADAPKISLHERILKEIASGQFPESDGFPLLRRFQLFFSRPLPWALACLAMVFLIIIRLSTFNLARPGSFQAKTSTSVSLTKPPAGDYGNFEKRAGGGGGGDKLFVPGDRTKMLQNAEEEGESSPEGKGAWTRSAPMIARTVSLSIVVKDFDAGRAALDAILLRHNGYAASLNVSTPQGAVRTLQASLRIPAPQLAAALTELKALGRVEAETQNGEEVTQQHADLVARIKNDRETELRLQDILRTRTGKVKDVLDVEQEIARVRGEIEQMEAEQKTLEHRVEFATIDLKLAEEYKAQLNTPATSVLMQLRNASINGFRNAFESLLALVLFLAESGPSLLLWLALLGVPAWRLWRRYRRAQSLGSLAGA
jgi:uncharacterized protein DUF4349/putative zinc finger protein